MKHGEEFLIKVYVHQLNRSLPSKSASYDIFIFIFKIYHKDLIFLVLIFEIIPLLGKVVNGASLRLFIEANSFFFFPINILLGLFCLGNLMLCRKLISLKLDQIVNQKLLVYQHHIFTAFFLISFLDFSDLNKILPTSCR